MTIHTDFAEWLDQELQVRDWLAADLARRGPIDAGLISRILQGERLPGIDACKAIARAFKISDDEVFRRAGHIQTPPKHDDPYFETLEVLWDMTPLWKRHDLVVHLRAFVEDFQRREEEREAQRRLGEPVEGYDVY